MATPSKKPAAKKPAAKKPAAKKPAAKKPAAKKPAAKKPAAKKPAAKKAGKAAGGPKPEVNIPDPVSMTNHIAIILDRSGSMSGIEGKVVSSCNEQLKSIRENAHATGQPTYASLYTFETSVDKPLFFGRPADKLGKILRKDFRLGGGTALLDAVGTAASDLQTMPGADSEHTSFLIVTITDGEENTSRIYKKGFGKMITKAQKTGRWSFAFLCPPSGVATLRRFGVPEGNIMSWETNAAGAAALGMQVAQGMQQFYEQRATGQRATTKFFVTNVASVDPATLTRDLVDLSGEFTRFKVTAAEVIRPFVDGQLAKSPAIAKRFGSSYKKGHAYYELTGPETVQAAKSLVILDKATDKLYGGDQARALLGLPVGSSCRVKPGDHGNYAIFVESTSINRKLDPGTTLLYRA